MRCIRIESGFGKMMVFVTDGKLPFPFGRETTGYQVTDLAATLAKAEAAGAKVLFTPYQTGKGKTSIVEFPGGYIAEIHDTAAQ
jgi:predicted enzyme related to lactoylglutathione lyase